MCKPLLPHQAILRLHKAALSAGLADSRDVLLAGMDRAFVASLPIAANKRDQLLLDLDEMNRTGALADSTVPLITWIANATTLAGPRVEAALFHAMRASLDARARLSRSGCRGRLP